MDLRQLLYFVAVAEELHFSRAAARLNLAQSALSAQVRRLEHEVGGPLLERDTRNVALTPAGETLLADARDLLARADRALTRARAQAAGGKRALVLGCLGPAPGELLAPFLAQFAARHPDVRVEVRAFDFTEVLASLRDERADLAFTYLPVDEPDLAVAQLHDEPRVVVLPAAHPLAGRSQLRPADLAAERFVTQPPSVPEGWRDFWLLVTDLGGARPAVSGQTAANLEEWLHLIAGGHGIDTAPAIVARYYSWPEIAFVPLVDAAPATLALVRRAAADDAVLDDAVELARLLASTAVSARRTPAG